ncbi:MAG: hypothetical protein ACRDSF_14655 [Pseudonocardiaceae bacterium]
MRPTTARDATGRERAQEPAAQEPWHRPPDGKARFAENVRQAMFIEVTESAPCDIERRQAERFGAPTLADYRKVYETSGWPWPGEAAIRRDYLVEDAC